MALLLTGLDQNILALLPGDLLALLLGNVKTNLSGHVLADRGGLPGGDLGTDLLGNSLTLLVLDLNKQSLIICYGDTRFIGRTRSDVISRGSDLTFVLIENTLNIL